MNKKLLILVSLALCSCAFQRANEAAYAQKHMVGLTKEQVLMCMGPAKRTSRIEGSDTDVWSYTSSSGMSTSKGASTPASSKSSAHVAHDKNTCTVNVVMKSGIVAKVEYLGPRGGMLTPNEQCAYAIKHCVDD